MAKAGPEKQGATPIFRADYKKKAHFLTASAEIHQYLRKE